MAKRTGRSNRRKQPSQGPESGDPLLGASNNGANPPPLNEGWMAFLNDHAEWCEEHASNEPLYALPMPVIDRLGHASKAKGLGRACKPVLSGRELNAERALSKLCFGSNSDTVGFWSGSRVNFSLLQGTNKSMAWIAGRIEAYERVKASQSERCLSRHQSNIARKTGKDAAEILGQYDLQLLGYAGRLLFDKHFRHALKSLKSLWKDAGQPMVFPLTIGETEWIPGRQPPGFIQTAVQLLKKWQLTSLVTLDLVQPQGPSVAPSGAVPHVAQNGITIVIPTFFDIASNRVFRDQIVNAQAKYALSFIS